MLLVVIVVRWVLDVVGDDDGVGEKEYVADCMASSRLLLLRLVWWGRMTH